MTTPAPYARSADGLIVAMAFTIACSSAGESQTPIGPTPTPSGWLTYSDATYRFSISYPSDYVILPDSEPPSPGLMRRVRFQDKQIASSPFADREPERFRIEVFAVKQPTPLATWLRSVGRLPADATVSKITLTGAREGLKVQQRAALAPNEFYYFATSERVYALTPLGPDGLTMLGTFVLLP